MKSGGSGRSGAGLRSRRRRGARGSAAVEFGLIVPVMLLLVFGICDFGWMLMRSHLVNNSARDAVRVASLGGTWQQIDDTADSELADAGITNGTVKITCTSPDGTTCDGSQASYDAHAQSGSTVQVSISYVHQWITPVGSLCSVFGAKSCVGSNITIQRVATMVRE